MWIKEIYMENFKSFGRKVRIPLPMGYIAITGPNGSGKSNITDAILFVLGPKSSKVLRAGKLTDLIFDGGKTGKPSNHCKVTLVFDNSDRIMPIDDDEVRLTRVVKRSASNKESYYSYFYVNERSSSLQEFEELLAHARITADGYNCVQQGDVNKIIVMSNFERRKILEDVAGITKYDSEIAKAEEKRKGVEDNLSKIQTVMDEVKVRISKLEKERDAALRYKKIKEKYDDAKIGLIYKKKADIEDEIKALSDRTEEYANEQKELAKNLEAMQRENLEIEGAMKDVEYKIGELGGEESEKIKKKIDEYRLKIYKARDVVENNKSTIKNLKVEYNDVKSSLRNVEKELRKLEKELEKVESEYSELSEEIQEKSKKLKSLKEISAKSDIKILNLQRDIALKTREIEKKKEEEHTILLEIERLKESLESHENEIAHIEEEIKSHEFQIKDLKYEESEINKELRDAEKSLSTAEENYNEHSRIEKKLYKEARNIEGEIRKLRMEYEKMRIQSDAAQKIERGYTKAVEEIITASHQGKIKGVHGTIAELGKVDEKYEVALTVAAGARMQSVVVDDDSCAAECIKYLKKNGLGRCIFLPLNKMIPGRPSGKAMMAVKKGDAISYAIDLIDFDPKYRAAFWFVFGDTIVVKELDIARKIMGGVRIVTLDGELIESSGAMIGGTVERMMLSFGAPSRKNLTEIGKKLQKLAKHSEKIAEELRKIREEMRDLQREMAELNSRVELLKSKLKEMLFRREGYKRSLSFLKENRKKKILERDKIEREIENLKIKFGEIENIIEGLKNEQEKMVKIIKESTPEKILNKMKKLNDSLDELNNKRRDAESRKETIKTKIDLIASKRDEYSKRMEDIKNEIIRLNEEIDKKMVDARTAEEEMNALLEMETKYAEDLKGLRDKRDALYRKKTNLEVEIDKLKTRIDNRNDLILQLRSKIRLLEDSLSEINSQIEKIDIKPSIKVSSLDDLESIIKECEYEMASLEPVNMLAITEYDEQMKRMEKLESDYEQLEEQRKELIELVEELNKKKKYGLLKVFREINKNFQEIYKELSGGLHAELLLENEENPFEGGLLIKAQTRHGKPTRLELLSGGQKSLAALSLIFAIQQYQPSPFYVLDEVDQNLDALNAEYVAKKIKMTSKMSQFIQVTLRKVTLKEASHIYGVVMQSNGLSEVVANINLSEISEESKGE